MGELGPIGTASAAAEGGARPNDRPLPEIGCSPALGDLPSSHVLSRQWAYRTFVKFHTRLLLRTAGRPEHLTPRLRCLVLETTGRHSNRCRRVPLLYLRDGDGFVILASNFGREEPPEWWKNLRETLDAVVEVGGRVIAVRARELEGEERERVLERAKAYNKQWRTYATTLRRPLPLIRLEPASHEPGQAVGSARRWSLRRTQEGECRRNETPR